MNNYIMIFYDFLIIYVFFFASLKNGWSLSLYLYDLKYYFILWFSGLFNFNYKFIITLWIKYGKGVNTNHNTSRCPIFPAARLDLTNITYAHSVICVVSGVTQGFVGPIGLLLQKCWLPVHPDTMQTSVLNVWYCIKLLCFWCLDAYQNSNLI